MKDLMKDLKGQGSVREQFKQLKEQAKALKEQAKALKDALPHISFGKKRIEIGDKGNILFYGLQKFPVSLYLNQVNDIKQMINDPSFKKFVDDNKDSISLKKPEQIEEQTA